MKQIDTGIKCRQIIGVYTDFIFINRFGDAQHQGTVNKETQIFEERFTEMIGNGHLLC